MNTSPANQKILVIGGAGYIGSHMVKTLLQQSYQPIVFDNLSTGHRNALPPEIEFIEGDLNDKVLLDRTLKRYQVTAVFHFAASVQIGESMLDPQKYYQNNLVNTLNLLDAMLANQIKQLIFSSSAAIYGEPQYLPVDINHIKMPVNAYGKSKWMIEQILQDYDRAYGLCSINLRYFNAAGADPIANLGDRRDPKIHLIPIILQVASGKRKILEIFGDDFDTPDGSSIRDYVHVIDLCQAHLLALEFLRKNNQSAAFNLGQGHGISVKEVIEAARNITQKTIPVRISTKRPGEPACLIADITQAKIMLGWSPKATLEKMLLDAWQWEIKN